MYTVAGGRCPSASCGRSVLYSLRNASKARCCSLRLERGGLAVSAFSVRCIRSCLPFCCGRPGWIRSGRMPSAELDPPDGQVGKPGRCAGGEGWSVVRADGIRESVLAEGRLEDGLHDACGGPQQALAPEEKPAEAVRDGERVHVASTAHPEVPLEVGAPDGVRSVVAKERSRVWRCSAPSGAAGHHQATPAENPRHRAARRKFQPPGTSPPRS